MSKVTLATLAALLILVGCNGDDTPAPVPTPAPTGQISMQASSWQITYSPTMPANPSQAPDGWYFDFPVYDHEPTTDCRKTSADQCPSVHYVTTRYNSGLNATALRIAWRVDETGAPKYQALLEPANTCLPGDGSFRLFLQRIGDPMDLSQGPSMRFWSPPTTLKSGAQSMTVDLDQLIWTNVSGQHDANGFSAVLANLGSIGVTFGGGCFAGHGVNLNSGGSRFTTTAFEAKQ